MYVLLSKLLFIELRICSPSSPNTKAGSGVLDHQKYDRQKRRQLRAFAEAVAAMPYKKENAIASVCQSSCRNAVGKKIARAAIKLGNSSQTSPHPAIVSHMEIMNVAYASPR